jgi:Flp pilus assembly pilin Flp
MDERGATAVEYALIVGLLAGGILVLVTTIGQEITAILNELRDALRV